MCKLERLTCPGFSLVHNFVSFLYSARGVAGTKLQIINDIAKFQVGVV